MRASVAGIGVFARSNRGNVTVMTALALPVLLGFVSLAAEFGHGLLMRTENQRVRSMASRRTA